jgi:hypothetical protein
LELEENDGKTQEEILALYLPALFSTKFTAYSSVSRLLRID